MISLFSPKTLSNWIDNFLERLEGLIFDNRMDVDFETKAFYVYRAYPSSLKSSQLNDWVSLQKRTLSPYVGGDVYSFAGKYGLCLWASPHEIKGIPETAMHAALTDGVQWVKGTHFYYQEQWSKGELIALKYSVDAPNDAQIQDIDVLKSSAWAKHRKIDKIIQEPLTWGAVAVFLFSTWVAVNAGSWLGTTQQLSEYTSRATSLEERLSDKLVLQATYQRQEQLISGIQNWQTEAIYLPFVLAAVAEPVVNQTMWDADAIAWQNNTLDIELISTDINITALISALEQREEFESVSIRPSTSQNTWNLQAKLYDDK